MAKAATDEQVELRRRARRRLIGSIALVTLIAVVLPWILENEPRPSDQEISIQIPALESANFAPRVVPGKTPETPKPDAGTVVSSQGPTTEAAGQADVLQAEQEKVLAAPVPKTAAQKEKSAPSKDAKTASEPKKKPAEKKDSKADSKQYVVQIAALADADKAETLKKELAAKGQSAYTEVVKSGGGEVTRVRVGPYTSRERADEARAALKSMGFDGSVVPR
jgi:DedD protein